MDCIDGLCWPSECLSSRATSAGQLNIAVICREYPPETAYGGMATYCYNLTHGLIREGHRVTVISQGRPSINRDFDGLVEVVRIQPRLRGARRSFEALRRRGKLSFAKNMLFYSLGLYKQLLALENARGCFDVIDLPDHGAEGVVPVLFWPRAKAVRLHSPWSLLNCMRANFFTEDDIEDIYALERATLHYADRVTSPSRELAERTRTFFCLEQEIPFIPNPLDTDQFRPAERAPGSPRVCFAGRFEVRKGLTTLFEAIPTVLKENSAVDFHLVGRDVCSLQSIYRPYLDPGRVHFHDALPLLEVPGFYQAADLAVVPSHYDNSPYTCVEPMACGLPVIGTGTGGMPELIQHGKTGLIIPGRDAGALAGAILQLLGDPVARQRMGTAARDRMVHFLDYRLIARRMAEEYRAAIAERRGLSSHRRQPEAAPGRQRLPQGPPDSLRAEIIILAKHGEGHLVKRTLQSVSSQGKAIQSVTVLWQGGTPPAFHGCRVFRVADSVAEAAARVFATVLTDFFVCLRAGDVLERTATTKIVWQFTAFEDVGVVSLPLIGETLAQPRRPIYPVFRSEAIRGRSFALSGADRNWGDILQLMYEQVHQDGWGEVILREPLLNLSEGRLDLVCRGRPGDEVARCKPRPRAKDVSTSPSSLLPTPAPGRAPGWPRRLVLWGIRTTSGPGLQPLRYRVRRFLNRSEVTKRLAAWLRREKGSLSTGGFAPHDDERPGVVILARTLAEGLEKWHSLRSREKMASVSRILVVTGCREPGPVSPADSDVAVYHLDGLVPPEFHAQALAHLLRVHARSVVYTAADYQATESMGRLPA
jgi:glycogen synthase